MGSGGNKQAQPPSANPAIQQVGTPSLFETIANKRLQNFSNWQDAPGPHDIMDAPGIGDMADIYGTAESLAQQKRLSNPQMALSGGGSGDYANQLNALNTQQRYDARAAGLSHGLQSLKDEAYGLGGSAANMEFQRKQAMAGDMMAQENGYYGRQAMQPPLWQQIAGIAVGGAGAILPFFKKGK